MRNPMLATLALAAAPFFAAHPCLAATDAARVQAYDAASGTYKPAKGVDSGDGVTVVLATGTAPGTSGTVKIKQPDTLEFVGKITVGTTATLLAAADAAADHLMVGGFSLTTQTVFLGTSAVTISTGATPGLDVQTGAPPVTWTGSNALYAVVAAGTETLFVWRVKHSVAP